MTSILGFSWIYLTSQQPSAKTFWFWRRIQAKWSDLSISVSMIANNWSSGRNAHWSECCVFEVLEYMKSEIKTVDSCCIFIPPCFDTYMAYMSRYLLFSQNKTTFSSVMKEGIFKLPVIWLSEASSQVTHASKNLVNIHGLPECWLPTVMIQTGLGK